MRDKDLEIIDLRIRKDETEDKISGFNLNILKKFGLKKIILLPDFCPGKSYLPVGTVSIFDKEFHTTSPSYLGKDIGCGMSLFKTDISSQDLNLQELVDRIDRVLFKDPKIEFTLGNHFIDLCEDENRDLYFVIHAGFKKNGISIVNNGFTGEKYLIEVKRNIDLASINRLKLAKAVYRVLKIDLIPPILDKPHNTVQKNEKGFLYRKGAVELFPDELSILPSNLLHPIFLIKGKNRIRRLENSFCHGTVRKASIAELEKKQINYNELRKIIKIPKKLTDTGLQKLLPTEYEDFFSYFSLFKEFISIEKRFRIIGYLGYKEN